MYLWMMVEKSHTHQQGEKGYNEQMLISCDYQTLCPNESMVFVVVVVIVLHYFF